MRERKEMMERKRGRGNKKERKVKAFCKFPAESLSLNKAIEKQECSEEFLAYHMILMGYNQVT